MYRIVIVEDESIIRKGLLYTIDWASMGCIIAGEADNGQSGLAMILDKRPEIVIADVRMPQMDGLEMLEKARNVYEFISIMLTGYSEFEYAQTAMRLGAVDYLLKPVDECKLERAIYKAREAIDRIRGARQWEQYNQWEREHKTTMDVLPEKVENYYVRQSILMIHERHTRRISLRAAAEELNVSESYLARKFKEITGLTFLDYLNQLRLNKALQLMRTGKHRIGEISDLVGFTQYKQFSVIFRRYLGMSPTEFLRFGQDVPSVPELSKNEN